MLKLTERLNSVASCGIQKTNVWTLSATMVGMRLNRSNQMDYQINEKKINAKDLVWLISQPTCISSQKAFAIESKKNRLNSGGGSFAMNCRIFWFCFCSCFCFTFSFHSISACVNYFSPIFICVYAYKIQNSTVRSSNAFQTYLWNCLQFTKALGNQNNKYERASERPGEILWVNGKYWLWVFSNWLEY